MAPPALKIDQKALQPLGKISWGVLVASILIDTSNARAFPAYNIVIGGFACFCGHFRFSNNCNIDHMIYDDSSGEVNDRRLSREAEMLLNALSLFSSLSLFSILLDLVYCLRWGSEVRDTRHIARNTYLAQNII